MSELHPIFDAKLSETAISVFDLETTGLSSSKNRVIQMAIVQVEQAKILDAGWSQFVHPGDDHLPLTDKVTELTKITDGDLVGQPDMSAAIVLFGERVEERFVAGHNIGSFDLKFMRKAEARYGVELQTDYYIDTIKLMRKLHPDLENHKLATCAKFYGLEVDTNNLHNALVDTKLTAELLLKQIEELSENDVSNFGDMLTFLSR